MDWEVRTERGEWKERIKRRGGRGNYDRDVKKKTEQNMHAVKYYSVLRKNGILSLLTK